MPFPSVRIHNPFPDTLDKQSVKAAKVLLAFTGSTSVFSANQVIPPDVLANAKGLAVLTVIKAAFVGSARFGSGIVVARLPDGSWSPPSAVNTIGLGLGGQIGFEFTDFVFILNDASAVKTFTQAGNLTFGGNVSIAAGPVGRNAEAAGSANMKGVAAMFAYSKTKGLFAGVSLEGGGMIERQDENQRAYGKTATAERILTGQIVVTSDRFSSLNQVLTSSAFNEVTYRDEVSHSDYEQDRPSGTARAHGRSSTWHPDSDPNDAYSNEPSYTRSRDPLSNIGQGTAEQGHSAGSKKAPPPPVKPKPRFSAQPVGANQAIAKFTFEAAQPGDLSFKKGEVITILKKTEKEADWWTGRVGGREGIFPSNYVKIAP